MSHILLIEPDAVLARQYQQALEHAGHMVIVAHGAQSAILSADQHMPDVVLLELQLSTHSGIEFLYEFRSYPEWQSIPVIVMSFIPEREFASSRTLLSRELGVTQYLYKPHMPLHQLVREVQQIVVPTT